MGFDPLQHIESYEKFIANGGQYDWDATSRIWRVPRVVFSELEPALRKGWRIFDAGCGTGLSSEPYASPDIEIYGVDGSSRMLELARRKVLYKKLEHMVIGKDPLPFLAHSFNLSLCLGVMAHFPLAATIPTVLQEATKPGGIIAFNYLDVADCATELKRDSSGGMVDVSENESDSMHCYYHSENEIEKICHELQVKHYTIREMAYADPLSTGLTRIVIALYEP